MDKRPHTKADEKYEKFLQLLRDQVLLGESSHIVLTNTEFKEYNLSGKDALQCASILEQKKLITGKLDHGYVSEPHNLWYSLHFHPSDKHENITMIIDIPDEKALITHISNIERKNKQRKKVALVLYGDNYLCLAQGDSKKFCYPLKLRSSKKSQRQKMLEIMRENKSPLTANQLGELVGASEKVISKEIKSIFGEIAKRLGIDPEDIYTSGPNGYRLVCNIIRTDDPAPRD